VTAPGPRDPQAELDHAEWLGWAEANGHDQDCGDCREAFTAGLRAQRDLDDATLAAGVRAGHVRIEGGTQPPLSAADPLMVPPDPLRTALESIASGAQGSIDTGIPLDREWVVRRALSALGWAQMPEPDEHRGPHPAPGHALVMRGTIALRDAEIELLRKRHEEFASEILGALLQALGADDDAAPVPGETPERRALRIAAYLGERVDELHGLIAEPAPEP
jgi:hypothetical protein